MKDRIISKHTVLNPAIRDDPHLTEVLTKILTEALTEQEEMMENVIKRRTEKAARAAAETAKATLVAVPAESSADSAPAAPQASESSAEDKQTIEKQQKEIDALLDRIKKLESQSSEQAIPEDASEQEKVIGNLRKKVQRQRDENKVWKKESNYWEEKYKDTLREGGQPASSPEGAEASPASEQPSSNKSDDVPAEAGEQEKIITNLRKKVSNQREEIKVWKEENKYWEDKYKDTLRNESGEASSPAVAEQETEVDEPEVAAAASTSITLDELVQSSS